MIQRYVAQQPPIPKPDRDLSQCKEEDEFKLGPTECEEESTPVSRDIAAGSRAQAFNAA